MNFEQFSLDPRLEAGIKAVGFTEPTPIQQQAIPVVLEGRDVLGLAQTGTGKTAAFALPILQRLTKGPLRQTRVLILVNWGRKPKYAAPLFTAAWAKAPR